MEGLAIFIGQSIGGIIIALTIITLAGFGYVIYGINKIQLGIDDKHKKNRRAEFTPGGILKNPDAYTWEEILGYKEDFNKIQLVYGIFEQFVPVFPLLGILGTVAGLIQQMGDIEKMSDAIALSMSTTFWGLIAAISLRILDAVFVSKTVNRMDLFFETFEQNYNMARDKYIQETENTTDHA